MSRPPAKRPAGAGSKAPAADISIRASRELHSHPSRSSHNAACLRLTSARTNLSRGTRMSLTATIRREYVYLSCILRTLWLLRLVKPHSRRTIVDIVEGFAARRPRAPAVYYQDEVMSYAQLDARANRYANWASAQGIKQGDCVALLMENRPDYL